MFTFEFSSPKHFNDDSHLQIEWLDTNGLGGWAGSTVSGCHTRRYHGLLVAATKPPTDRMVLVSKLDETIVIGEQSIELGVNHYGDVVHPQGYRYLKSFSKGLHPQFVYEAESIVLRKSLLMLHGENTTIIKYEVLQADDLFQMELLPLLAARGYHQLSHANAHRRFDASFEGDVLMLYSNNEAPDVFIHLQDTSFHRQPDWYYNFHYSEEQYRGLDFTEDLFSPGKLIVQLKEGSVLYVVLSAERKNTNETALLFARELKRRQALIAGEPSAYVQQLLLAADQFIVNKGEGDLKTIIAGYHWFTDWGRDTMIALPGLCLSTKRFEDAKKILYAFAQSVDRGMLPNRFQDNGEAPEYNNVDGTLQYFIAIYEYLQATKDKDFVLKELLPVLKEIIDWHYRGTRYNIKVDADGLLHAGEKGYQLTWMDARVGDWVVTPRMGKPVEIQALWYNALCIFSMLLQLNGQDEDADNMLLEAQRVKQSFAEKFWYEEGGYLYDVIDENNDPDKSLRPNQLLTISLPFPLINGVMAKSVMRVAEDKLHTPKGMRSLSSDDELYIAHYGGDQWHRDAAYHQGIVWGWLLGPYVDGIFKTNGYSAALSKAAGVVKNFLPHLKEGGVGSVSEIFDAEPPFAPRGCIAQAWSVGEWLRVIKKYKLDELLQRRMATTGEVKAG